MTTTITIDRETRASVSPAVNRALELDSQYGEAEASRQTGVPRYALRLWRRRLGLAGPPSAAKGSSARPLVVDAYLRFRARELVTLQRRAFEGCRCREAFVEDDGLCILCGHPADWERYRLAMRDALTLTAGSAEAGHDRDAEAVYA